MGMGRSWCREHISFPGTGDFGWARQAQAVNSQRSNSFAAPRQIAQRWSVRLSITRASTGLWNMDSRMSLLGHHEIHATVHESSQSQPAVSSSKVTGRNI
jgi:hypothetical protein